MFWSRDLTSGDIFKGTLYTDLKELKHPYVHCSIVYNHQYMEAAQVSISKWVGKTTMGHLHNEILLGHKKGKKKKILPFATVLMILENIMLSEIIHSEKDKYYMISLICRI